MWSSPAYLGEGLGGPIFAPSESSLLVLGPPRSGKSFSIVMPNVLMAEGAVLSTSTKADVMLATWRSRAQRGRCWLYDPSLTYSAPPGVTRLAWSPMISACTWEGALGSARALVASSASGIGTSFAGLSEGSHWKERAEALLSPLLHAAALGGRDIDSVMSWIHRQDLSEAERILSGEGATLAADVLAGIASTDPRERSGIFSTTAGTVAVYRSDSARMSSRGELLNPMEFVGGCDTIYVCSPSRQQTLAAPLVVGLSEDIRAAAYARSNEVALQRFDRDQSRQFDEGLINAAGSAPVLFALDEAANIAPLPDLPAIASEGSGQGLLTLACFQDLSQARARWGEISKGFLSLFGSKLILPGIGDIATLEALSVLAGDEDVSARSRTIGTSRSRRSRSITIQPRTRRRLPPDIISRGSPGTAMWFQGGSEPSSVRLADISLLQRIGIYLDGPTKSVDSQSSARSAKHWINRDRTVGKPGPARDWP